MNIGIIGPGRMGSTLGRLWAKAGHHVFLGHVTPLGPKRLRFLSRCRVALAD